MATERSQELALALAAFLEPLRLNHGLELRYLQEPKQVHVVRRGDGLARQEMCYIRVEEAPLRQAPARAPKGVRIGGGYHVAEMRRIAASSQNPRPTGQLEEAVPGGEGDTTKPKPEEHDRFAFGQIPSASSGQSYSYGTFTRGEARHYVGDRRQRAGGPGYTSWSSVGAPPRGDGAFRVLSSDRRPRGAPVMLSTRVPQAEEDLDAADKADQPRPAGPPKTALRGPAVEALDGLLMALGLEVSYESGVGPEVIRTRTNIAGRWKVELCYVSADRISERVVEKQVKVSDEKIVTIPIEVERPKPSTAQAETQTTERWCSHCGAPGHGADHCPQLQLEQRLSQQIEQNHQAVITRSCQLCGAKVHTASECPLLPPPTPHKSSQTVQTPILCQLCHVSGHTAPQCPVLAALRQGLQPQASPYAEVVCQLCEVTGHTAPQCPQLAGVVKRGGLGKANAQAPSRPSIGGGTFLTTEAAGRPQTYSRPSSARERVGDERPTKLRIGGGYLVAPEVPGLADGGLDEAEALLALASAKAAGCLRGDGTISYAEQEIEVGKEAALPSRPLRSQRPASAPPGGRRPVEALDRESEQTPGQAVRVVSGGQFTPQRFMALEEELAALSKGIRSSRGRGPDRPHGFLFGTFVQGSHSRHRFSSERGARAAFRVFRSRITQDATITAAMLRSLSEKLLKQRSVSPSPERGSSPNGHGSSEERVPGATDQAPMEVPQTAPNKAQVITKRGMSMLKIGSHNGTPTTRTPTGSVAPTLSRPNSASRSRPNSARTYVARTVSSPDS